MPRAQVKLKIEEGRMAELAQDLRAVSSRERRQSLFRALEELLDLSEENGRLVANSPSTTVTADPQFDGEYRVERGLWTMFVGSDEKPEEYLVFEISRKLTSAR